MMRITVLILGCLVLAMCAPVFASDPVSPLFGERLDNTLNGWERAAVTPNQIEEGDPISPFASVNPYSLCLGSICVESACFGSLCLNSGCLISGCAGSTCIGSMCLGSICGASACYGSSLCARICSSGDGASIPASPLYNAPSCSPLNCPEM